MTGSPRPNIFEPDLELDDSDPDGYRAGMERLGAKLGAKATGASVYELPPGQSICPYHFEYGEEEWLIALAGRPTVRSPEGESELAPGEVVFFPTGPAGAHKVTNRTEETVRVLMFSEVELPAVTSYPDSDKVGAYTGDREQDVIVRRESAVDYFEGEA